MEADSELKQPATKDDSDWSDGGATEENLFLSLPLTTSLVTEHQVSGISEKSDVSESVSEMLGLRGEF